jgi:hypothetical protein
MATLTISFTPPSPAPANGFLVKYRKAGDSIYTQVTPNPTSSPVVISGVDGTSAYEGFIQSLCTGSLSSDNVQFSVGALAVLENFDYLVLRYKNNSGGTDLDTFTGFADNGLPVDINYGSNTNWVGFAGGASSYITWGGDNTSGGGVEAVLIDFKKLITDFPSVGNSIRVRLHSWWYASRSTGNVQLELQTWLGGAAPTQSGYDFIKSDGATINDIQLDTNVTCVRGSNSVSVNCAQKLAEIIYDKINKTAVLVPVSGGCGCTPACYNYTLTNEDFSSTDTVIYTDCSGSSSSTDVFPGSVISICAQQGTVSSQYGYAQISENGTC